MGGGWCSEWLSMTPRLRPPQVRGYWPRSEDCRGYMATSGPRLVSASHTCHGLQTAERHETAKYMSILSTVYRCIYIFDRLQLILPFVCIIIVPLSPSTLGVQLKLLKGKAPQGAAYFTCLWTSKIISIVLRKKTDIYPKSAISFKAIKYKIISDCTTKKWLQILLILLHDVTLSRYRCNKDLSV